MHIPLEAGGPIGKLTRDHPDRRALCVGRVGFAERHEVQKGAPRGLPRSGARSSPNERGEPSVIMINQ
jgi:hypothetical protein